MMLTLVVISGLLFAGADASPSSSAASPSSSAASPSSSAASPSSSAASPSSSAASPSSSAASPSSSAASPLSSAASPSSGVGSTRCRCAPEAIVRSGKAVNAATPIAVVLDEATGSRVVTLSEQMLKTGASSTDDVPPHVSLRPLHLDGVTPSRRGLFAVDTAASAVDTAASAVDTAASAVDTAASADAQRAGASAYYVGLARRGETFPKDVVKIVSDKTVAAHDGAAELRALFLGPREVRHPSGCGEVVTHAVSSTTTKSDAALAGFVVTVTRATSKTVSFVDARHVRMFGIGRVDACEHGAALDDDVTRIDIAPVGADLNVNDGFSFAPGLPLPTRVSAPSTLDPSVEDPFREMLDPDREEGLGHASDRAALGVMLGLVGLAATLAFLLWPVLRRRRRFVSLNCPACRTVLRVNLFDEKTDGMFCPSCGKSSIFVRHQPNGTPEAHVFELPGQ